MIAEEGPAVSWVAALLVDELDCCHGVPSNTKSCIGSSRSKSNISVLCGVGWASDDGRRFNLGDTQGQGSRNSIHVVILRIPSELLFLARHTSSRSKPTYRTTSPASSWIPLCSVHRPSPTQTPFGWTTCPPLFFTPLRTRLSRLPFEDAQNRYIPHQRLQRHHSPFVSFAAGLHEHRLRDSQTGMDYSGGLRRIVVLECFLLCKRPIRGKLECRYTDVRGYRGMSSDKAKNQGKNPPKSLEAVFENPKNQSCERKARGTEAMRSVGSDEKRQCDAKRQRRYLCQHQPQNCWKVRGNSRSFAWNMVIGSKLGER